jgi:hypothetical protein
MEPIDPIDQLRSIILNQISGTASDGIARVSVSPWVWDDLWQGQVVTYTFSGWEPEECRQPSPEPIDSSDMLRLTIDPEQVELFRLWNREGKEITPGVGRYQTAKRGRSLERGTSRPE